MDLLQIIRTRPKSIVIVDDHFSDPDVSQLDSADLTRFYELLGQDTGAQIRVATALNIQGTPTVSEIVEKAEANASLLWKRYRADDAAHPELATLFLTPKLLHDGETQKLRLLTDYCRNELKADTATFTSLDEAATALGECVIAFVDFYLKSGIAEQAAMTTHKAHRDRYRLGFTHEDTQWPKIVFLISSKLPGRDQLQAFRTGTGLRSAFYVPLRKGDLTTELLRSQFAIWAARYDATAQLDHYLTTMSSAVRVSAELLTDDIERLELHDLTMLKALKLSAEHESLQGYLTWLLSEALASKVRSTPSLQTTLLPTDDALALLDGKLLPGSVLFELFSDIAVSPISSDDTRPAFGDIYSTQSSSGASSSELLLAITPACDLMRCSPDDPVLCVRGVITKADAKMDALLGKKSLFGKGSHVIRYSTEAGSTYAHIVWTIRNGLKTLPAKALVTSGSYKKIARLSELFAQEVKELAMAEISRIGIPVDPIFSVAGAVTVRANFLIGKDIPPIEFETDLSDRDFISVVITKGRIDDSQAEPQDVLMFTQQFADWLMTDLFPATRAKTAQFPPKLASIESFFKDWRVWYVVLSNRSKTECNGSLAFKYGAEALSSACPSNKMEIIVSVQ